MLERIYQFLPAMLVPLSVAIAGNIYAALLAKKYRDVLNDKQWTKAHPWKCFFLFWAPFAYGYGPVQEELIFRMPLIIIFSGISPNAWIGIVVSAATFAIIHWHGGLIATMQKNEKKTEYGSEIIAERMKKQFRQQKSVQMVVLFIMGTFIGYYGVYYQSIWVSVGMHAAWNLLYPIASTLLLVILFLLISGWDWCVVTYQGKRFLRSLRQSSRRRYYDDHHNF